MADIILKMVNEQLFTAVVKLIVLVDVHATIFKFLRASIHIIKNIHHS
jgi:hypothetical protein